MLYGIICEEDYREILDWDKRKNAQAGMRKMVKRLLKKYHYPPDDLKDAVEIVLRQCEMWTDNVA